MRDKIVSVVSNVKDSFADTKITLELGLINYYDIQRCKDAGISGITNTIVQFTTDHGAFAAAAGNHDFSKCASSDIDVADDLEDALIDGLNPAKVAWKDGYQKMLFIVTDSPAHGTQYWDRSKLAVASLTRDLHNSSVAAGTIEALVNRYCKELTPVASVQVFDLYYQNRQEYNFTSQMVTMMQAANSSCVSRSRLAASGLFMSAVESTIVSRSANLVTVS